jgi:hypothetical protein
LLLKDGENVAGAERRVDEQADPFLCVFRTP